MQQRHGKAFTHACRRKAHSRVGTGSSSSRKGRLWAGAPQG